MDNYRAILGALSIMLVTGANLLAQDQSQATRPLDVLVLVVADDDIQALAESYIMRELRSRHDMSLVEENADWELRFNVTVLSSIGGKRLGFAMSVTAARHHNASLLKRIFPDTTKHDLIDDFLDGSYEFIDTFLHVGPIEGLRELCGRAVADIDINALERGRNF